VQLFIFEGIHYIGFPTKKFSEDTIIEHNLAHIYNTGNLQFVLAILPSSAKTQNP